MLESLLQDLRFAVRVLWKSRAFTLMAVATMGLAIGATTSMFSVIEATLIRWLPFQDPQQLMMLYLTRSETGKAPSRLRWAYPRLQILKASSTVFDSIANFGRSSFNITGIDQPLRINGEIASATYFQVLRVQATIGRTYLPEEDATPGEKAVCVIGNGFWKRLFGGSPDVLGKTIGINQVTFTIIGVMPEDFGGLSGGAEVWVPNMMAPVIAYPEHLTSLQNFHNVVARLRSDVALPTASAEMAVIGQRIAEAFPPNTDDHGVWGATLAPLDQVRIDPSRRRAQVILLGAVSFLLLIACVNTASLLLGRAASREREMSIRRALGSSRRRLVRQLLTESLLLALLGGALGLLLSTASMNALAGLIPPRIPSALNDYAQLSDYGKVQTNGVLVAFAAMISLLTGILFGIAPALYTSGSPGPIQRTKKFRPLVITEFALALTLLVGATLLIESFMRLQRVDAGFDPANVLTFYVQPPQQKYEGRAGPALLERILERVSAVPSVQSATVSICTPLMGSCARSLVFPGESDASSAVVGRHYVGPDHFKTLGIPLLRGRAFTGADRIGAPNVVIVSQSAARKFWPNEDPIGQHIRFGSNPPFDATRDDPVEIVGVVGDVKYGPLEDEAGAHFYTPFMQFSWWYAYVMVRTSGPPTRVVSDMRRAVASVDPNLPIDNVLTMEERIGVVNQRPRFSMVLLSIFAGLAVVLAGIGIYGVTSHSVTSRMKEIGIRMALGAEPGAVSRLILREGLTLVGIGVTLGAGAALALTRILQSQLYEVSPTNPLAFAITILVLIVVGAAACYFQPNVLPASIRC